ncbi:MAG: MBL fold metallo-hydrolase [Candidatus Competibacterales bacterium]
MAQIFDFDFDPPYGQTVTLSPRLRRLTARNPSSFTFKGTNTFIVGRGRVAVVDPGPALQDHLQALEEALATETVTAIVATHHHRDHVEACRALQDRTGAPVWGFAPPRANGVTEALRDGATWLFCPDEGLADGDDLRGDGWTLRAIHTPGHASDHLCLALLEDGVLLTGDHVMAWSTSVIPPPDGSMADYRASLERLLTRDETVFHPAHGPPSLRPRALVANLLERRQRRECQILAALTQGGASIEELVARIYLDLTPGLKRAAGWSVMAHVIDLAEQGKLIRDTTQDPVRYRRV